MVNASLQRRYDYDGLNFLFDFGFKSEIPSSVTNLYLNFPLTKALF